MNVTETVIREQFGFWDGAATIALPEIRATTVVVVGCGTSYYLAQTIASAFNAGGRDALAVPGAEWARRMGSYLANREDVLVLGLSRSGTTTETIQALQASQEAGLPTLAISCEPESTILQLADDGIYLPTHGAEGIVMSVSASLMLIAGLRLAGAEPASAAQAAAAMAAVEGVEGLLRGRRHFVYLGAGPMYGAASEGGLKLMEMSISFSQAFHPLEYRHGPISLIDEGSAVVMLYSAETEAEEAQVVAEVRAKGAVVIGFGGPGDLSVPLATTGAARAVEVLPALQLIGEKVALSKGLDTSQPRHLTKVVTLG